MIPQETVELILDTARIEDVVSDFVTLKRRGANFVACCPFHNEKTPSFYVSPAKGIYKCFGCGKAGSAVGFIMEHEHYSYNEALRYLASKYHIEVNETEETADEIMRKQKRESLMLVSDFARKFYSDQLSSGEGRTVGYAYYKSRSLEDETISRFGLGWAPSGRTALLDAARNAGYKEEYLIDSGLCVRHEDGSLADKFHERVMFPIHNVAGRVIAFSGRTLRSDNPAKYVNTAETEIYTKGNILYGIYFAKNEISRQDKCVLVEGNVDMVMMHQLGLCNVVASCGTSLTVEQIRLIKKYTENVTIIYDGDNAGIHAALRGIDLILAEGLNVKVVLLPQGEDPDSFARKHSKEEMEAFISSSERDFIDFKCDILLQDAAGDPVKKANLINNIADTVSRIPDPVKRSVYVDAVADKFKIDPSVLFGRISTTRKKQLEEERVSADRRRRYEESGLAPDAARTENQGSEWKDIPSMGWVESDKIVAPIEKDILYFILNYGSEVLDFPSDSDFYQGDGEEKPLVADFIRGSLDADGSSLINPVYAKVFNAYMDYFDSGKTQDEITKMLMDSQDREIAFVASCMTGERHQLTVKNFEAALTTKSSWLATFVPKTLVLYAERKLESRINSLMKALPEADPGTENGILSEIVKLQGFQNKIKKKL